MYKRPHFKELVKRLKETRNFIQVLAGRERLPGIDSFSSAFPRVKPLLVGKNGFPPEDFLQIDPGDLFD